MLQNKLHVFVADFLVTLVSWIVAEPMWKLELVVNEIIANTKT